MPSLFIKMVLHSFLPFDIFSSNIRLSWNGFLLGVQINMVILKGKYFIFNI